MIASREVICSRDIDSLSRSGSCITMPSARPRGMMVALWIGSVAMTLRPYFNPYSVCVYALTRWRFAIRDSKCGWRVPAAA
jgi:hypothetical protein